MHRKIHLIRIILWGFALLPPVHSYGAQSTNSAITIIPEPMTLAIAGAGLLGLGLLLRRRQK